ncbi:MAG: hypothetical protein AAF581_15160 [Planctomycetota bacterium]
MYEPPAEEPSPDNRSRPKSTPSQIPGWTWAFVAACIAIPIVALGGLIPGALGGGGAAACVAIARLTKPAWQRATLCTAVTASCWGLFGALIVFVAGLNSPDTARASQWESPSYDEEWQAEDELGSADSASSEQRPPRRKAPKPRRTDLSDEDTRREIYGLATRMLPKIAATKEKLEERRAEGRSTDFFKHRIEHLEEMRTKQQAFALKFYDITRRELDAIIEEGDAQEWPQK